MNADDLGRFSMADLFRLEVEHQGQVLTSGLLTLERDSTDSDALEVVHAGGAFVERRGARPRPDRRRPRRARDGRLLRRGAAGPRRARTDGDRRRAEGRRSADVHRHDTGRAVRTLGRSAAIGSGCVPRRRSPASWRKATRRRRLRMPAADPRRRSSASRSDATPAAAAGGFERHLPRTLRPTASDSVGPRRCASRPNT